MRMKTFTKAVALFVVMALMMVITISAASVTDVEVTLDASDNKTVTITAKHPDGAAAAGKTVNIVVTDGTTDIYWNDAEVGDDGTVTFEFEMNPATDLTGTYGVEMGGTGLDINPSDDEEKGDTFTFVNTASAVDFINAVNPLDSTALKAYLEGNTDNFDGDGNNATQFDVNCAAGSDYVAAPNKTAIMALLCNEDYAVDQSGYYKFLAKFNQAVTIDLLNNGLATDVVAKYKNVFGFDTSWYESLAPAQYPAIEAALIRQGFELYEGDKVVETFDKATALALYNNLNQATKANFIDYITYTNGKGYTNPAVMSLDRYNALPTDVYRDMVRDAMVNKTYVNGTYATLAAVETAFDAALDVLTTLPRIQMAVLQHQSQLDLQFLLYLKKTSLMTLAV